VLVRCFACICWQANPMGLFISVACEVARRVREHETKTVDGFTERYGVDRLVWF
jgi:predicted GIY-YIG superfamily endonuclease